MQHALQRPRCSTLAIRKKIFEAGGEGDVGNTRQYCTSLDQPAPMLLSSPASIPTVPGSSVLIALASVPRRWNPATGQAPAILPTRRYGVVPHQCLSTRNAAATTRSLVRARSVTIGIGLVKADRLGGIKTFHGPCLGSVGTQHDHFKRGSCDHVINHPFT